ncbi:DUF2795 domain-containing protein [Azospirillum sp. TSO35-2]|uniref:DUF2795 domain-containing protein n=1 Tax=Azospirillum sp. TSO35-2 TaxID=716796 RepID=UPI000D61EB97|nr:DUF2795 domain-containing protein [Azospirillum sp. TSO35-2]PWC39837.1 hypothetical protein TSO352_07120 [Azospirillum sp. TSO35-2]
MTRGLGGHSPANISHHLKGIDFPADKADVAQHAKKQGADKDILDILEKMPDGRYENMADVMKGVGKVE